MGVDGVDVGVGAGVAVLADDVADAVTMAGVVIRRIAYDPAWKALLSHPRCLLGGALAGSGVDGFGRGLEGEFQPPEFLLFVGWTFL